LQKYLSFFIRSAGLSFASFLQACAYGAYEGLVRRAVGSAHDDAEGSYSVLVVQLGQIGDFVLTLPLFAALKEAHGERLRLCVLTDSINKTLACGNPDIDGLILYNSPKYTRSSPSGHLPEELRNGASFDQVLWLRGDRRVFLWMASRMIPMASVTRFSNPLRWSWLPLITGRPVKRAFPHFVESLDMLDKAARPSARVRRPAGALIRRGGRRVYIHIGSGSELRRWPRANFSGVCAHLLEWDPSLTVCLLGSKDDSGSAELIRNGFYMDGYSDRVANHCGVHTLDELSSALSDGDLYIGFDSGPMHIAAASGIPIVALMGPQSPQLFGPWTDRPARIIYKSYYCSPCWQFSCLHSDGGPGACVLAIKPQEVFDEAKSVLEDDSIS